MHIIPVTWKDMAVTLKRILEGVSRGFAITKTSNQYEKSTFFYAWIQ